MLSVMLGVVMLCALIINGVLTAELTDTVRAKLDALEARGELTDEAV